METMARFKMKDLDKMGAELATTILVLHVTDVFKEDSGDLDQLTKDLFKIQIPSLRTRKFSYSPQSKQTRSEIQKSKGVVYYLETFIDIIYPGKFNPTNIKVVLFYSGGTWKIRYTVNFDGVESKSNITIFNSVEPNMSCTPYIYTNAWGDICMELSITDTIQPEKIFINFLETMLLDVMLQEKKSYLVGQPDLVKALALKGEELRSFIVKFQNRLLSGR